jgi:hypothetical protein
MPENHKNRKLILKMELENLLVLEDMLNELPRRYSDHVQRILNYLNQFVNVVEKEENNKKNEQNKH